MLTQVLKFAMQRLPLHVYQTYYTVVREKTNAIEALVTHSTESPLLVPPQETEQLYKQIEGKLMANHPKNTCEGPQCLYIKPQV